MHRLAVSGPCPAFQTSAGPRDHSPYIPTDPRLGEAEFARVHRYVRALPIRDTTVSTVYLRTRLFGLLQAYTVFVGDPENGHVVHLTEMFGHIWLKRVEEHRIIV